MNDYTPKTDRSGMATAGMVLGIIGVVFAFIPLIGVIAFILCPLAIIFGALGLQSTRRGQGWAGIWTGAVGLAISIIWFCLFVAVVGETGQTWDCLDKAQTLAEMNAC